MPENPDCSPARRPAPIPAVDLRLRRSFFKLPQLHLSSGFLHALLERGMTSILGIFGAAPSAQPVVDAMLLRMVGRGSGGEPRTASWRGDQAFLAIQQPVWQREAEGSATPIAEGDGITVVADAAIYYRADLVRDLRHAGVDPSDHGAAALILAAYRAWGEGCVDRLEGDWAFVLWDARVRKVLCARDFAGRRSLHYAAPPEGLVVATTLGGVLAHRSVAEDLNIVTIAETAASLMASSHETCYRAVNRLHAGHALSWHDGVGSGRRFWNPRPKEEGGASDLDADAEHLRHLLRRSIEERLSPTGPTTLQLSGGWDSTAIYGVGKRLLGERSTPDLLRPVSISYPPGDPGREDEIIQMILDHWDASTHWLDIADIPLVENAPSAASQREEPFVHVYEEWNRRLARAGRDLGSRVMFDGFGGDSLFQSSPFYLADLLRTGRLRELRREWKFKKLKGAKAFYTWCIQPSMPLYALSVLEKATRSRAFAPPIEREVPAWFDPRFVRSNHLVERERRNTPRYRRDTCASDEIFWHLTNPWIPRMLATNYATAIAQGVEIRSPLFDRRIVEFAMNRPWFERSYRKETKRLLRRSVAGLLPDDVLAPRRYRTGMTTAYLRRELESALRQYRDEYLRDTLLADLGILRPAALTKAIDGYFDGGDPTIGVQLFFTLQTELWLRSKVGPPRPG
jgi:asparagine synthase (glutamine-hydrolysing)